MADLRPWWPYRFDVVKPGLSRDIFRAVQSGRGRAMTVPEIAKIVGCDAHHLAMPVHLMTEHHTHYGPRLLAVIPGCPWYARRYVVARLANGWPRV